VGDEWFPRIEALAIPDDCEGKSAANWFSVMELWNFWVPCVASVGIDCLDRM